MPTSFVLSDATPNSYGFAVQTGGIDLSLMEQNPVMLYNHDRSAVIGRWENMRVENEQLIADPVFDTDEYSQGIAGKVERGMLRAASISLEVVDVDEVEDMLVVSESVALEASIVPIGSNRNAMRLFMPDGQELNSRQVALARLPEMTQQYSQTMQPNMNIELNDANRRALNLSADASQEAVNAAISDLIASRQTAEDQLAELNRQEATRQVDQLITEGRLLGASREQAIEMAASSPDQFKQMVAMLPTKPELPTQQLSRERNTGVVERETWSFDDWRKKDPKGLVRLKAQEPERYQELLNASGHQRHIG